MAPEAYEGQERAAEGRRGHMGTLEATRGIRRLLKGVEAGEGKEWRVVERAKSGDLTSPSEG